VRNLSRRITMSMCDEGKDWVRSSTLPSARPFVEVPTGTLVDNTTLGVTYELLLGS
jgi:hypothetical protein